MTDSAVARSTHASVARSSSCGLADRAALEHPLGCSNPFETAHPSKIADGSWWNDSRTRGWTTRALSKGKGRLIAPPILARAFAREHAKAPREIEGIGKAMGAGNFCDGRCRRDESLARVTQALLDEESVGGNPDTALPKSPEVGGRKSLLAGEVVEIVLVAKVRFDPPPNRCNTVCAIP